MYRRGPVEALREELDNAQTWEEYEDIAYRLDAYSSSLVTNLILASWVMTCGDRTRLTNITITS